MTSEIPAHELDNTGVAPASVPLEAPLAPIEPARRTQPPSGSSGKHPLPNPWPQQAASSSSGKHPLPNPRLRHVRPQPSPDAEAVTASPTVASDNWLPEPDYWLADHQRIPRPPTRPIARPKRFRRMSRLQSALLAVIILIAVIVIGAGMYEAGRLSGDFFNNFFSAPHAAPTAHPTTPAATPTISATQP